MIRSSLLFSIGAAALVASSCQGPAGPADLEGRPAPAIATNAIATNAIATNAIATNAIATNAIATNGLAGSFNADGSLGTITRSDTGTALEDPDAQMFMQYLVSCVLEPHQRLRWTSRFTGITRTWRGDLGLCPQWLGSAPSQACRERASACLLARNNVFGIAVPLSLRGDLNGNDPIPLADSVGLWPKVWRSNDGVASVEDCENNESGVGKNCGWSSAGVGRCTPGETVRVGAGACGLGNSQGNTMLRVCTRMHFCDSGGSGFVAHNDDACGSNAPLVEFTCPDEGYYAVMAANRTGNGNVGVTPAADPPLFPSSEVEVFGWREGAFYGNIFDAGALNPLKPQVRVNPVTGRVEEQAVPGSNIWTPGKTVSSLFVGVAHLKMWACSSGNWLLPDAYYERRMCGGVGGINCAAKYAGACSLVCNVDDRSPAGDRDYDDCADLTGQRWQYPITPALNHPCDLLPLGLGEVLCRTLNSLPIALPTL